MEDALVVGCLLISLLKQTDRVKIGCLAKLVNVIASIMTENGGDAWTQMIYYPYTYASQYGRGHSLVPLIQSTKYDTKEITDIPHLESIAVHNEEQGGVIIFAVNRLLDEALPFEADLSSFGACSLIEHLVLEHTNLKAVNTAAHPEHDKPHNRGNATINCSTISTSLGKASWNVIRLRV
jgi:alpha-N-arabinofuranosidase